MLLALPLRTWGPGVVRHILPHVLWGARQGCRNRRCSPAPAPPSAPPSSRRRNDWSRQRLFNIFFFRRQIIILSEEFFWSLLNIEIFHLSTRIFARRLS